MNESGDTLTPRETSVAAAKENSEHREQSKLPVPKWVFRLMLIGG